MSEWLNTALLAVLQGVAEFLPISSSGHLVIAQHALGAEEAGLRLDVVLHAGTLLAVFVFYRATIARILLKRDWRYVLEIVLSALPAVAVYFAFRTRIDALFANVRAVGALLMFTGAVLIATRFMPKGDREVSFLRALWMGCLQAVALLPGVSRSGMTLAAARAGRVKPEAAAEFSFLMSAPLILGGLLLECRKICASPEPAHWGPLLFGFAVAAVTGYLALAGLVRILRGRHFWLFGPYCALAGLLTIVFAG